jgi:RecA-family ATPase
MSKWDEEPVPPREWAVAERIPLCNVSLISGEGAIGKTILELQRSVAHVLGKEWIGTLPELGPAIYLGAEDPEDELHRRLAAIVTHSGARFADLIKGGFHLVSLCGEDAVLGAVNRYGIVQPTERFQQLLDMAGDIKPKSITIDPVADVFAGNENDRSQTRQFVGLMRRVAMVGNSGLVLCSHPSLTGINTGTGMSGSTGWHNSVRARGYFRTATTEKGDAPDPDLRILEWKKNNYGPISENIYLRWRDGVFVREGSGGTLDKLAAERKTDDVFLDLLNRFSGEGRNTSEKPTARNYAPTLFAAESEAKQHRIKRSGFEDAMRRLFKAGKIRLEPYGAPSRSTSRLARI